MALKLKYLSMSRESAKCQFTKKKKKYVPHMLKYHWCPSVKKYIKKIIIIKIEAVPKT